MKLRNKLTIISGIACLAFAGVGFAAWAFTKSESASVDVEAKVTAAIEAKDLKVEDGNDNEVSALYLICDAPSGEEGLLPGNGIYWSTEADGKDDLGAKSEITALTLVGSVEENDFDIADISTYDGYFSSSAIAAVTGTWVNIAASAALDQTVTSTAADADVEYVWNLPAPSYAQVPTSVAEVALLQAEVAALSLTFAFSFNVSAIH
jgi:hypothetical protein